MHMERQEKVLPFGTPKHLSTLLRLYIYALHGYFIEVSFTAIWDFFLTTKSWKLAGCSSLWSLLIYGTCGLALEKMSYFLHRKEISIAFRSIAYLLTVYFWEFTSGYILTYFNACPWDYSEFSYNIGGLVTLEYAPFWLIAGLATERIILGKLEHIRWSDDSPDSRVKISTSMSSNGASRGKAKHKRQS
ncbi:transmembrane protein 229b [Folsomia candida]|uniref:Transmembrane protein 229B n=1 Tax=Folsomia candida TaxID=158441 RepID=A0A226EXJ6_FOLCA|nr:transmembrane protein 229b [Folsomia candida]OXA62323.1 hypothetical protein Fcan01_02078 [Folsomia candida]